MPPENPGVWGSAPFFRTAKIDSIIASGAVPGILTESSSLPRFPAMPTWSTYATASWPGCAPIVCNTGISKPMDIIGDTDATRTPIPMEAPMKLPPKP